jgi:hypothetical protein
MAKKKKEVFIDDFDRTICHRKISAVEECLNKIEYQACYPVPCNDERNTHAFVKPCEECHKTVIKRSGFMTKEDLNRWFHEKWPSVISNAIKVAEQQKQPKR